MNSTNSIRAYNTIGSQAACSTGPTVGSSAASGMVTSGTVQAPLLVVIGKRLEETLNLLGQTYVRQIGMLARSFGSRDEVSCEKADAPIGSYAESQLEDLCGKLHDIALRIRDNQSALERLV